MSLDKNASPNDDASAGKKPEPIEDLNDATVKDSDAARVKGGFNPQPDPPGKIRGFDPQPDPPAYKKQSPIQGGY